MPIDSSITNAINRCIELNMPFAYVIMPGDNEGLFFASDMASVGDGYGFMVRDFELSPVNPPLLIREDHSINDILSLPADYHKLEPHIPHSSEPSASHDQYIKQAEKIIKQLRLNGGKTVLSRLIHDSSTRKFTAIVNDYFEAFQDTMRFVYFTPQTGLWFGASPELLIDYDKAHYTLSTMSLAGTRKIPETVDSVWDEKNVVEHQFVTDYILECLNKLNIHAEIYDNRPLRFGDIEHLCDRIKASGAHTNPISIADRLSPTPALCGMPREAAYRQIIDTESHHRHCYGGWIGINDCTRFTAYVNLRSAYFDGKRYNIYAGGGLTKDSVAESEWVETERKSSKLREILHRNGL